MANSSTATVTIIISGFGIIIQVSSRDQSFSDSAQELFILGGLRHMGTLSSASDLNNKQKGLYLCNSAQSGIPQNAPSGFNGNFVYIGFGEGTTWGIQMIFSTGSNEEFFFRTYVSSAIWAWKKVQVEK